MSNKNLVKYFIFYIYKVLTKPKALYTFNAIISLIRFLTKRNKWSKMSRLNIELPDEYTKVLNMLKISNESEIKDKFEKASQVTTIQFILLEFIRNRNMITYINMIENNKEVKSKLQESLDKYPK